MSFVEITPKSYSRILVPEFLLDACNSFEILKREQAPHVVARFNPLALLNLRPDFSTYEEYLIKLPGSPIFVPEWLAASQTVQTMAGHRMATSAFYEQDAWGMLYEKNFVHKGKYPRPNLQSVHTDDRASSILSANKRSVVTYHVESGIPPLFYKAINADTPAAAFRQMAVAEEHYLDTFEYEEADEVGGRFYNRFLASRDATSHPSGTMTCFGGMVIHGSDVSPVSGWRAMLHLRTFPVFAHQYNKRFEGNIAQNPPLHAWYKKHLAPAA